MLAGISTANSTIQNKNANSTGTCTSSRLRKRVDERKFEMSVAQAEGINGKI